MNAEIYAICYGRSVRTRGESFIGGDPHDGPMPMAYYIWLIRQQGRLLVVDTGFDALPAALNLALCGSSRFAAWWFLGGGQ